MLTEEQKKQSWQCNMLMNAILYIIGDGDVIGHIEKMVKEKLLEQKVIFIPKQNMEILLQYTVHAI